jgi:hypothetical protein
MTTMNPVTRGGPHPPALPDELLFEPDGHLTDVALACVADGELALVPAAAMSHIDDCDRCSHRLGETALLSLDAGIDLRGADLWRAPADASPVTAPQVSLARSSGLRRRRPPVAAIAAALLLTVLTAGPSLVAAIRGVPGTLAGAATVVPFLVRVAMAFLRAPWGAVPSALFVKCASALVLAAVGLGVARLTSRSGSTMEDPWQQGGV